jgi:diketogulonate reductase-like aldo/keto reductase
MADTKLQKQFQADEVLKQLNETLRQVGLDLDLDISSIHLRAKQPLVCPPGQSAVWEAVEHPDGSVSYQWVCR